MSEPKNSLFDYKEESSSSKLARKASKDPFMPIGLVGLLLVCGFGIYKYRTRGQMSTSVYLMQLRVAAQGTVVGALTMGVAYTMADKYLFKHNNDNYNNSNNDKGHTTKKHE